jgi:hypothetical protein
MSTIITDEKLASIEQLDKSIGHDAEQQDRMSKEYKQKERKLVRKLDMTLMPTVWVLYLFNYLDRNNIASVLRCRVGSSADLLQASKTQYVH